MAVDLPQIMGLVDERRAAARRSTHRSSTSRQAAARQVQVPNSIEGQGVWRATCACWWKSIMARRRPRRLPALQQTQTRCLPVFAPHRRVRLPAASHARQRAACFGRIPRRMGATRAAVGGPFGCTLLCLERSALPSVGGSSFVAAPLAVRSMIQPPYYLRSVEH